MRATFAPFQGAPTVEAIAAVQQALSSGEGPVLAYCRSGTRSITAWAIAMAESRQLDPDAILLAARDAGYDLAALKELLRSVAEG